MSKLWTVFSAVTINTTPAGTKTAFWHQCDLLLEEIHHPVLKAIHQETSPYSGQPRSCTLLWPHEDSRQTQVSNAERLPRSDLWNNPVPQRNQSRFRHRTHWCPTDSCCDGTSSIQRIPVLDPMQNQQSPLSWTRLLGTYLTRLPTERSRHRTAGNYSRMDYRSLATDQSKRIRQNWWRRKPAGLKWILSML